MAHIRLPFGECGEAATIEDGAATFFSGNP